MQKSTRENEYFQVQVRDVNEKLTIRRFGRNEQEALSFYHSNNQGGNRVQLFRIHEILEKEAVEVDSRAMMFARPMLTTPPPISQVTNARSPVPEGTKKEEAHSAKRKSA